jgi:5'-methylthioadenosine phosphorylase
MEIRIAVIGGTGVYEPDILHDIRNEQVSTPYGDVELIIGNTREQRWLL